MDVYFVRHGETEYNRRHIHQPGTASLNERGVRQADHVATLIAELTPTHLFCSPMARAEETAKPIGKATGLRPEVLESVAELSRPNYVYGYHHFGLRSIMYQIRWFFEFRPDYWRRVNGESRPMFLGRVHDAKVALQQLPPDARVVVVSHSIFINFFVAHICNEKPLSFLQAFSQLLKINQLDNSSLTHIQFDHNAAPNTCPWQLITFDQDEHVIN